jgi:glycosyltransferase involved in cell wall biosynthesis
LESRVRADKITMIPYGADAIESASVEPVAALGLKPGQYLTVVARAEPENSLLEIVKGFSVKRRGMRLVVLGAYQDDNAYHRAVQAAASAEVLFAGAIYDKTILQALRFHCAAYVHGHQVGGTNPSLVEALGAGNAVIAHDNRFNRWVAGQAATYFDGADGFSLRMDEIQVGPGLLPQLRENARQRFSKAFTWPSILGQYERLLETYCR